MIQQLEILYNTLDTTANRDENTIMLWRGFFTGALIIRYNMITTLTIKVNCPKWISENAI